MTEAPAVTLVEMSSAELTAWLPAALERLAAARTAAGAPASRALEIGESLRATSFPDGSPAPGHHAMHVVHGDGTKIGAVLLGPGVEVGSDGRSMNLLELDEHHRDDPTTRATLEAVEHWVASDGATRIAVYAFGPDYLLRAAFEERGYVVAATSMFKALE
jgi:hypothetical protein